MEPLPDITGLEIFPSLESHTLEFKENFSYSVKAKCISTICSFLNAKGGHIIFGIEDKGRRIIGLPDTNDSFDGNLRWFDNFYHNKKITDSNGEPLTPGELHAYIIEVSKDRKVIVAKICPTPGKTYKCSDGSAWYRLAASIYRIPEGSAEKERCDLAENVSFQTKKATQKDQELSAIRSQNLILIQELSKANRRAEYFRKEFNTMKNDMKVILGAAKSADERLDSLVGSLEKDILSRKERIETSIKVRRFCLC